MSFGSEMRDLAAELTQEFAGENGDSTLYHLDGESYDTATGETGQTWSKVDAPMPEEKIAVGSAVSKSSSYSGTPFEYAMSHRIVTVAGSLLGGIIPAMGDVYQSPGRDFGHEVVYVDWDMYGAAYILHIMLSPKDLPVVV